MRRKREQYIEEREEKKISCASANKEINMLDVKHVRKRQRKSYMLVK